MRGPTTSGNRAGHLLRVCEGSLRRLATDHIDVYHVHGFDVATPLDEVLTTLDTLVKAGKVRYLACSNYTVWQMVKALGVSERRSLERYVAVQSYYSLVARASSSGTSSPCVVTRASACSCGARSPAGSSAASSTATNRRRTGPGARS